VERYQPGVTFEGVIWRWERYQPGVTFEGVIRRWRGSAGDNQPTFDSKGSSTRGL
jgi:hypothetical protein